MKTLAGVLLGVLAAAAAARGQSASGLVRVPDPVLYYKTQPSLS